MPKSPPDATDYILVEVHGDRILFGTLCGTIGLYEVAFYLNDEEKAEYEERGKAFLRDLAYDVCRNESRYAHRRVRR
jgi:hypothetical protein